MDKYCMNNKIIFFVEYMTKAMELRECYYLTSTDMDREQVLYFPQFFGLAVHTTCIFELKKKLLLAYEIIGSKR